MASPIQVDCDYMMTQLPTSFLGSTWPDATVGRSAASERASAGFNCMAINPVTLMMLLSRSRSRSRFGRPPLSVAEIGRHLLPNMSGCGATVGRPAGQLQRRSHSSSRSLAACSKLEPAGGRMAAIGSQQIGAGQDKRTRGTYCHWAGFKLKSAPLNSQPDDESQ